MILLSIINHQNVEIIFHVVFWVNGIRIHTYHNGTLYSRSGDQNESWESERLDDMQFTLFST